jgi:ribonuclease R
MPSKPKKSNHFNLKKDPYKSREAEKYEQPIASREHILQLLAHVGKPLRRAEIAEKFAITEEDQLEALRRRLRAMERDGQLLFNRVQQYCLVNNKDLIAGRVIGHPDGFGFLKPDNSSDDLFLSPREMMPLLHNDRAMVRIAGIDRKGRREGAVVEILERNTHQIVGRLHKEDGFTYVIPEQRTIAQTVLIQKGGAGKAKPGQIVVAEIVEQPSKVRQPIGRVIEILGNHLAPGMEIEVAIRTHGLPYQWPDDVLDEIKALSPEVPESAKQDRTDLRKTPLVTIDGEDARDFDDAVYCQKTPKGWKLLVAIADVAHYVCPNTALDREAKNRSTSVYFPERVIPMLPEILSNGLCSLNPAVDRLCMVCELLLDDTGKVTRTRFFEGVMRSHARLTYTEVAKIVVDDDTSLSEQYKALVPQLQQLYRLYKILRVNRDARGAMDFDTQETRIIFGTDRKIEKIVPTVRNDAHRLIEEFMITANTAAAEYLNKKKMPKLLRIHEGPGPDKLLNLKTFLGELGLSLGGGDKPTPIDYMHLVESVKDRPDNHLIQTVLLRSMSQAVYSPELKGHFGLALAAYAHFTSPIRRYPDLLVHRAIKHCLLGKKPEAFIYGFPDMITLGEQCSANERRADDATRDVVAWLKCEYMMDKIGDVFPGIISAVTSFGFFVELADIYVEGLVHISSIGQDYFHFDPTTHQLIGERTGGKFRIGDAVQVKVTRVSLDDKKIDFDLITQSIGSKKKPTTTRKKAAPAATTQKPAKPKSSDRKKRKKKPM